VPSAPDGNSDEADAKNPSMAMQAPQPARHEEKSDEKVSISDKWIIGLTAVIAFTSIVAAFIFGKQLTAMQGQLDAMAFSERPWLSLDVRPSGPLLHNDKGWSFGISWYLPLSYRVKNLGKTPATDVAFFAHIVPVVTGEGGIFIPRELDRACTFWEKMQQAGIGITELVFPQEEWPEKQFTVHGREEDFEAAKSADGMKAKYLGQCLSPSKLPTGPRKSTTWAAELGPSISTALASKATTWRSAPPHARHIGQISPLGTWLL
jgi:hypothetical protein